MDPGPRSCIDRSSSRGPLHARPAAGALPATERGALRPDQGHGGHARSSPTQSACDGEPGSRRPPGSRVAAWDPKLQIYHDQTQLKNLRLAAVPRLAFSACLLPSSRPYSPPPHPPYLLDANTTLQLCAMARGGRTIGLGPPASHIHEHLLSARWRHAHAAPFAAFGFDRLPASRP